MVKSGFQCQVTNVTDPSSLIACIRGRKNILFRIHVLWLCLNLDLVPGLDLDLNLNLVLVLPFFHPQVAPELFVAEKLT